MPSSRSWRIAFHALFGAVIAALLLPNPGQATPSPSELGRQLSAASQQLEVVVEQYDSTDVRLTQTKAQLSSLNRQLQPLERAVNELRDEVGQFANAAYKSAGGGPLTALLATGSPRAMLDQLTVLEHVGEVHRRHIAQLDVAQRRYQAKRGRLDALITQQDIQQADLAAKRTAIESQIAQLQEMRLVMYGPGRRSTPRSTFLPKYVPGAAGGVIRYALAQLGKAYVWGAAGPRNFDCSGLTMAAWRTAGVSLPHSSSLQWNQVAHLSRNELRPGDLVFYYRNIHHVALYLGQDRVIQAPNYGEDVSIAPVDIAPIYGYGRPRLS